MSFRFTEDAPIEGSNAPSIAHPRLHPQRPPPRRTFGNEYDGNGAENLEPVNDEANNGDGSESTRSSHARCGGAAQFRSYDSSEASAAGVDDSENAQKGSLAGPTVTSVTDLFLLAELPVHDTSEQTSHLRDTLTEEQNLWSAVRYESNDAKEMHPRAESYQKREDLRDRLKTVAAWTRSIQTRGSETHDVVKQLLRAANNARHDLATNRTRAEEHCKRKGFGTELSSSLSNRHGKCKSRRLATSHSLSTVVSNESLQKEISEEKQTSKERGLQALNVQKICRRAGADAREDDETLNRDEHQLRAIEEQCATTIEEQSKNSEQSDAKAIGSQLDNALTKLQAEADTHQKNEVGAFMSIRSKQTDFVSLNSRRIRCEQEITPLKEAWRAVFRCGVEDAAIHVRRCKTNHRSYVAGVQRVLRELVLADALAQSRHIDVELSAKDQKAYEQQVSDAETTLTKELESEREIRTAPLLSEIDELSARYEASQRDAATLSVDVTVEQLKTVAAEWMEQRAADEHTALDTESTRLEAELGPASVATLTLLLEREESALLPMPASPVTPGTARRGRGRPRKKSRRVV